MTHAVVHSHERLAEPPQAADFGQHPILRVTTLGPEGLKYRARFGGRVAAPLRILVALNGPVVRDTTGAGDWSTAGLLHCHAREGAEGFRKATPSDVGAGLWFGQALAARRCAYLGARGGMEQDSVPDFPIGEDHANFWICTSS